MFSLLSERCFTSFQCKTMQPIVDFVPGMLGRGSLHGLPERLNRLPVILPHGPSCLRHFNEVTSLTCTHLGTGRLCPSFSEPGPQTLFFFVFFSNHFAVSQFPGYNAAKFI